MRVESYCECLNAQRSGTGAVSLAGETQRPIGKDLRLRCFTEDQLWNVVHETCMRAYRAMMPTALKLCYAIADYIATSVPMFSEPVFVNHCSQIIHVMCSHHRFA